MQRGVPVVLYAATLAQALPLLAAVGYARRLPPARRWVVVWCVALLAGDAAQLWFRTGGTNNLWLTYIVVPLHNAIMLWTLSLCRKIQSRDWRSGSRFRSTCSHWSR